MAHPVIVALLNQESPCYKGPCPDLVLTDNEVAREAARLDLNTMGGVMLTTVDPATGETVHISIGALANLLVALRQEWAGR